MQQRKIYPIIVTLIGTLAAALAAPAFGSYPERGYQERPCGLDMNRNGIRGEAADCRVCDALTADPDGDGVDEDLIYVDCSLGADTPSCGDPATPCRSIDHAWNVIADGPGDGAEDILCFRGTCLGEELVNPGVGGVPGTFTTQASGSEARDWLYPSNPTMLVGWDSDGDGAYPPFDGDDEAVLDGSAALTRAFRIDAHNDYLEMAHFTARDYGRFTSDNNSGFMNFRFSSGGAEHIYIHDLHLESINRERETSSAISVFNLFAGNVRPRWVEMSNLLVTDNAGWFGRGEVGPGNGEMGPLRWKNVTRTVRGCNVAQCGGSAASTAFRIWGYTTGIEILDSVWDANVDAWNPNPMGGPPGARFVSAAQCSRDWTIRNNEVIDYKQALEVQGHSATFCDGAEARPVDDVVFDANVVRNTYEPWQGGDHAIQLLEGGDGPGELVEDVTITNNFFSSAAGWEAAVWVRHGHQNLPVTGRVVIANNTMYGDINRFAAIAIGDVPGVDYPQMPQNIEVKNNLIAGLDPGDLNVVTTYAPSGWDSDFNVFDPVGAYEWAGSVQASFAGWASLTGEGSGSRVCVPSLAAPVAGDFHLSPADVCARDQGTELPAVLDRDVDGDPRGVGGAWDVGADEAAEAIFADGFESGNLAAWSSAVP